MATKIIPEKSKLIISIIFKDEKILAKSITELEKRFSSIDFKSDMYSFSQFSSYYHEEMGENLQRVFVTFSGLVAQDELVSIKNQTDSLEKEYMQNDKRSINVDPGILTLKNFVLATHKDFTHRIYLRDGVYADLTLMYTKGSFQILPWTYPDYSSPALIGLFNSIREKYKLRISS